MGTWVLFQSNITITCHYTLSIIIMPSRLNYTYKVFLNFVIYGECEKIISKTCDTIVILSAEPVFSREIEIAIEKIFQTLL